MRVVVSFVLPVKTLQQAKTRLAVTHRADVALAMLLDTLEAVLAADAGPVTVVSPDPVVAQVARDYGVDLLAHGGGLNEACAAALGEEFSAVVLPDLPALRPDDLRDVVMQGRGFVADARGTGTTMAFDGGLVPRFGPGSAAAFAGAGLPRLQAAPGARRDVDDTEDLRAALELGVGRHTHACLDAERPAHT